uniref:Uncharacterized protein n=1 Tax=Ananas comosus var. bracteatus TaxID=296719 RepID=A0A6V7QQS0_ANACO|nr:unnamed protein product [Ananas comosus var. bracteatus]
MTPSSSGHQRKEAPSIVFENTTPLCSKVFIAESENFTFSKRYLEISGDWEDAPLSMVLDWAIGNETCVAARRRNASDDYACIDENSSCYDSPDGWGIAATAVRAIRATLTSPADVRTLMNARIETRTTACGIAGTSPGNTIAFVHADTGEMEPSTEVVAPGKPQLQRLA